MVILADGGWSQLKQCVTKKSDPEYGGYVLYRGLLPLKEMPECAGGLDCSWFVGGRVVGKKNHELINFGCYMWMPENQVPKPTVGENR